MTSVVPDTSVVPQLPDSDRITVADEQSFVAQLYTLTWSQQVSVLMPPKVMLTVAEESLAMKIQRQLALLG